MNLESKRYSSLWAWMGIFFNRICSKATSSRRY